MVSSSKILRQPSLILIITGTSQFNFNRVFLEIDKSLSKLKLKSKIVVQASNLNYPWLNNNIIKHAFLNPSYLIALIKSADKIICHCGFGTIYTIGQNAKIMPLIIPRLAEFHEHVNNHQKHFSLFSKNKFPKRLKKYFCTTNIKAKINNYLKNKTEKNEIFNYLFNNKNRNLLEELKKNINEL